MRLKDNRDLQKFLQDCQEVRLLLTPPFLSSHKSSRAFGIRALGIIELTEARNSYHVYNLQVGQCQFSSLQATA